MSTTTTARPVNLGRIDLLEDLQPKDDHAADVVAGATAIERSKGGKGRP